MVVVEDIGAGAGVVVEDVGAFVVVVEDVGAFVVVVEYIGVGAGVVVEDIGAFVVVVEDMVFGVVDVSNPSLFDLYSKSSSKSSSESSSSESSFLFFNPSKIFLFGFCIHLLIKARIINMDKKNINTNIGI